MFRVVKDRERWFGVVMGEAPDSSERSPKRSKAQVRALRGTRVRHQQCLVALEPFSRPERRACSGLLGTANKVKDKDDEKNEHERSNAYIHEDSSFPIVNEWAKGFSSSIPLMTQSQWSLSPSVPTPGALDMPAAERKAH